LVFLTTEPQQFMLTVYMIGKVYLVGIGTGCPDEMTPRATNAITRARVVIGHGYSLDMIHPLLEGKEVIGQGMNPLERSTTAVEYCLKGETVAIISSGDPGIYAIASTFFSFLKQGEITIPVEVIPGLTTSTSAAARLGSPLGNDFAVISLADQAGCWSSTQERLKQAATSDFVLVLYNPLGKLGRERFLAACQALEELRDPCTAVGVVSGAGSDHESAEITTLGLLCKAAITGDSLIIIGNSTTFVFDNWMITPRAYQPGLGY